MKRNRPILVVDDDEDIRDTIIESLELEGYTAVGAADGASALKALRTAAPTPAFVLLDLMMPGMSGAEFRREQLEDPALAGIPIVVFSADPNAFAIGADLGAAGCLKKPLKLQALLDMVEKIYAALPD